LLLTCIIVLKSRASVWLLLLVAVIVHFSKFTVLLIVNEALILKSNFIVSYL